MQTPNVKVPMVFLSALLFVSTTVRATLPPPTSARTAALGNTSSAAVGSDALFGNQAALARESMISGIFLYDSKFGVAELSRLSAGFIWPITQGTIGIRYHQFGTGFYRHSGTGVSFARHFGLRVSAALTAELLAIQAFENRVPLRSAAIEGGIQWVASDQLLLGLHLSGSGISSLPDFSWRIETGAVWSISRDLEWVFGIHRNTGDGISAGTGWEYRMQREVALRLGVSGKPLQPAMGIGFHFGQMVFDLSFAYHPYLGVTPLAAIKLNRL